MAGRLQDKVALVTGAGSIGPGWGNGKAIAVLFARVGARVFGVDVNLAAAEETGAVVAGEGGTFEAHRADVAAGDQVEVMVEACLGRFGRIDVLVNNVGIVSLGGPVELAEAEWDRVHAVNLKSAFLTSKHVLPAMVREGKGAIVNIASIAAHRYTGVPYASYYSTKGALIAFSRGVALEYAGRGIRCNTVSPGLMNTPMVHAGLTGAYGAEGDVEHLIRVRDAQCPMGRMGDAWDVAHACLFLASDEARYITAVDLLVDGGITAKYA
ncbi:MAG TPA: SDR family oxidoreductase [Geminicoccaceae bacterium]|nr:SDR family oxidoreductase [Geminicoccaceae bacterium]